MCSDGEAFLPYAKAEKELCHEVGLVLSRILGEIQERHGISVAELRITMDWSHSANGWPGANCVMVREHEGDAARVTQSESVDGLLTALLERRF